MLSLKKDQVLPSRNLLLILHISALLFKDINFADAFFGLTFRNIKKLIFANNTRFLFKQSVY